MKQPLVLLPHGDEERRNGYGRNDFKKDRGGFAYHMEGTAHAALLILKLLFGGIRLFLLLFTLIARIVLSFIGITAHD